MGRINGAEHIKNLHRAPLSGPHLILLSIWLTGIVVRHTCQRQCEKKIFGNCGALTCAFAIAIEHSWCGSLFKKLLHTCKSC